MTLTHAHISAQLHAAGLSPRRALGQNFVIDANTVRRIARLCGVGPTDRVLEIGAGLGLVVDSFGMLALCIDRGSAAQQLDLGTTELVVIEPDPQAGQGIATAVQIGSKQTPGSPGA